METIRYSPIGKEDISFGIGSFEVTLADGRMAMLTQVDVGALLNAGVSTTNLVGLTLTTPTFAGVITFSTTPVFPTLTAKSMTYVDASNVLTSTAAPTNGQLLIGSTGAIPVLATLTAGSGVLITNAAGAITISSLPRSYLAGYGLSTAGGSTTMTIAAGQGTDSTNAQNITRVSVISKTTASWTVGTAQGGLDSGSIQASTWYHFYAILRTDTGVVDVTFSTNATTPSLPANYSFFRRFGSGKTDGSSNWTAFLQDGDNFYWNATPTLDVSDTTTGISAKTATLTVPTGLSVQALCRGEVDASGLTILDVLVSDLAATDEAPSESASPLSTLGLNAATGNRLVAQFMVRTNTSAQVRYRATANATFRMVAYGWIDTRGKNA